ncbi:hypothetical protein, partial [Streptomyces sp. NPDC059003]|uniref:hypothetical protein n=1 Tax=Streptomyces sp. NPDC059003 TaxID=3346691 RepID=UPI0036891BFF
MPGTVAVEEGVVGVLEAGEEADWERPRSRRRTRGIAARQRATWIRAEAACLHRALRLEQPHEA